MRRTGEEEMGVGATAVVTRELMVAIEIRGSMLTSFMEPMVASAAGGDIEATLARLRTRFGGEA